MSQPIVSAAPALRPPLNRVSPRAIWYWTVRAAFPWVALLALQIVFLVGNGHRELRVIILVGTALVALAHLIVMPQWRYRVHRWEVTADAVYTQAGWLTVERRIAPISRIQTVDTERGVIEQLFSLANVTVTTASAAGPLRIHGLDRPTADRLAHELTRSTQAGTGDAT